MGREREAGREERLEEARVFVRAEVGRERRENSRVDLGERD